MIIILGLTVTFMVELFYNLSAERGFGVDGEITLAFGAETHYKVSISLRHMASIILYFKFNRGKNIYRKCKMIVC